MRFNRILVACFATAATCVFAAPQSPKFESYTKAYQQAGQVSKPMLVILNDGQDSEARINVESMKLDGALDGYVVAEIDTTTAHGQEVHKLFKSPSLPHVVVIDDKQQKQLYKTSRVVTSEELANVLETYRNGAPKTVTAAKPIISESAFFPETGIRSYQSIAPPADCPSCQRNAGIRF